MSPSLPFTNVTEVGRRAGAEPRRSAAPDRRPIDRSLKPHPLFYRASASSLPAGSLLHEEDDRADRIFDQLTFDLPYHLFALQSPVRLPSSPDSPVEGDGFEPSVPRKFLWCPVRSHAIRLPQNKPASLATGTDGSNPSPSAGESVLTSAQPRNRLRTPRLGGVCAWAGTREGDGPARELAPWPFFLCRALMQSHLGRATRNELWPRRCRGPAAHRR